MRQCHRKMVSGRKVAGAIRSLVNDRALHEIWLIPVFMHGSETMVWKEKV